MGSWQACWILGIGGSIYGNRLIKKTEHGSKAFYCCFRKDLKCPVRVILNKAADQLVAVRGEHNHNSAKLGQLKKEEI